MKINQIEQVLCLLRNLCSLDCDDCPFAECCLEHCPGSWNIYEMLKIIEEYIK